MNIFGKTHHIHISRKQDKSILNHATSHMYQNNNMRNVLVCFESRVIPPKVIPRKAYGPTEGSRISTGMHSDVTSSVSNTSTRKVINKEVDAHTCVKVNGISCIPSSVSTIKVTRRTGMDIRSHNFCYLSAHISKKVSTMRQTEQCIQF